MKNKNNGLNIAILVICIIFYLFIFMLMGPLRGKPGLEFLTNYMGVFSAFLVVLTTIMTMTNYKRGFIISCILCSFSILSAGISVIHSHSPNGLPGVFTPLINIGTMAIIIKYMSTSQKQQEELSEQYEKTMDANRIVEEQNKALKIYAYKDLMTNMYNLTYFRQQIEAEIEKNRPLSIIYMDLDNFKGVNDTFGPKTGDVALRLYADRISSYCGNKYVCARTNGDDFAVMIAGEPTEADILNMIEQFRKMLAEPASIQGETFSITASYGIAAYPRDGRNSEVLLDNAIMAVYNAKANGKDRPCFFSQA